MHRKLIVYMVLAMGLIGSLKAQNITVTSAAGQDVATFVRNNLCGKGVSVTNVKFSNVSGAISTDQIGTFQANGFGGLQMDSGIVMTTGNVDVAPGPNWSGGASQPITGFYSDPEMEPIATGTINGCATLDFDFVGLTSTISFMYTFASEEYPEYVCSSFNDVFAFYVTGPDPQTLEERTWNVAVIPNTVTDSTPNGIAVAINTVNPGVAGTSGGSGIGCVYDYATYYNENTDTAGIEYDGYTSKLMAQTNIVPCALYHMHLSVCNVGDNSYDSGVFLESGSFSSPSTQLGFDTRRVDTVRVGCTREVPFDISRSNYTDGVCHVTFGGNAVYGQDFTCENENGETLDSTSSFYISRDEIHHINLIGLSTAVLNGTKTIDLCIETSVCPDFPDLKVYDTMHFVMSPTAQVSAHDTLIEANHLCTFVSVRASGGVPPYSYQWVPADNLEDPTAASTAAFITEDCTYQVIITDRFGCSYDTATVTVDIHTKEGIDDVQGASISVYPNPAEGQFAITADDILQVEMFNVSGQKVFASDVRTSQVVVNTENLPAGTYYLRVVTSEGQSTHTVIVKN